MKNFIVMPRMSYATQRGAVAVEYVVLLVFVAAVLFGDYKGKNLLDVMLEAIKMMNIHYIKGLSYPATVF